LWKKAAAASRPEYPPAHAQMSYPSAVCSSTGAAAEHAASPRHPEGIHQVAVAIDQLAAAVRTRSGSPEHMARVAEIWLMVASLDPELARCAERYGAIGMPTAGAADGGSLP
jgi:hypothetical protein